MDSPINAFPFSFSFCFVFPCPVMPVTGVLYFCINFCFQYRAGSFENKQGAFLTSKSLLPPMSTNLLKETYNFLKQLRWVSIKEQCFRKKKYLSYTNSALILVSSSTFCCFRLIFLTVYFGDAQCGMENVWQIQEYPMKGGISLCIGAGFGDIWRYSSHAFNAVF